MTTRKKEESCRSSVKVDEEVLPRSLGAIALQSALAGVSLVLGTNSRPVLLDLTVQSIGLLELKEISRPCISAGHLV